MTTQTCKDRIEGEWANTRQDLNRSTDEELSDTKHGKFLSYDYVESKMYNSTRKNNASIGYWRYQMSWGDLLTRYAFTITIRLLTRFLIGLTVQR